MGSEMCIRDRGSARRSCHPQLQRQREAEGRGTGWPLAVSARGVANRGLARPARSLVHRGSQTAPKIRWICPTDLSDPPRCTNPGPGRLAQKMSVMSVEPPARGAPGGTAAERAHRPGSQRLGGVEATGASPGVAASRPHRSGPRAGPGRRTPCARTCGGGLDRRRAGVEFRCMARF